MKEKNPEFNFNIELFQDLKAICGLDPDRELFRILAVEIEAMMDKHKIYHNTSIILDLVFEFYDTDVNPRIKKWQEECKEAWRDRETN